MMQSEPEGRVAPRERPHRLRHGVLRRVLGALIPEIVRSRELRDYLIGRLEGEPDLLADARFRKQLLRLVRLQNLEGLPALLDKFSDEEPESSPEEDRAVARAILARLAPIVADSEPLQRQALEIIAHRFRRSHGARKLLLALLAPRDEHEAKLFHDDLARLGLEAFPRKEAHHYVPDHHGRSADKLGDIRARPGFGPLARAVVEADTTLLYYDRLYTLYTALEEVVRRERRAMNDAHIAEVGVYRGGTTWFLAGAARALGLAGTRVHGFDTFAGHPEEDLDAEVDRGQAPGKFASTDVESVRRYLAAHDSIELHVGRFQDTCGEVAALRFALVHADVDLRSPTLCVLDFFHERLIPGGVFVVDDWDFVSCPGVKQAAGEFLGRHPGYTLIPLQTGQALLWKLGHA